jgi:phosphinothricin acetyltransferase
LTCSTSPTGTPEIYLTGTPRRTRLTGGRHWRKYSRTVQNQEQTRVVPMEDAHAAAVLEIYRVGIDGGNATFETEPPPWERFVATRLPGHRFVAVDADDRALGWVACSPVSPRGVYAGVVEHSVYVHPDARGKGLGKTLLRTLIDSTEAAGIWTIQSGIFPENTTSLAMHGALGFRVVGSRERIARHHGRWRDVVLVERRSPTVG